MFTGWLSFAGVEIVNEARVAAYVQALGIPGYVCQECPGLRDALEQAAYTTPAADNAPWYDPAIPESGKVAGFQIASIEGIGDTSTRSVANLARDGAAVGARRRAARELTVTFRAVASTEAAVVYATSWLARVLHGRQCLNVSTDFMFLDTGTTCAGDELCLLTACPSSPADVVTYKVGLSLVGVTSGPEVTKRQTTASYTSTCALVLSEMEVVFTAGDPSWYSSPVTLLDGDLLPYLVSTAVPYNILTTYETLGCGTEACDTPVPVGCATTVAPLIANPPTPCVGQSSFTANFYSIPLSFSGISTWLDMVPVIYYTGSPYGTGLSQFEGPVSFQLRRTTASAPCGTVASPCDVCMELFTAQQQRGMQGVIDWVRRKAYRINASLDTCAYPTFTRQLAPFNWPTLTCGSAMCLDVYINGANDGRAGKLRLDVMRRADAIS